MNSRGGVLIGIAITTATAAWWLGAQAIVLSSAQRPEALAVELLAALWSVRALVIAVLGVRAGVDAGWRPAWRALLLIALVPWPLVLLGFSASDASPAAIAWAEASLLVLAAAVAGLGHALRLSPLHAAVRPPLASAGGALLAAVLWWQRTQWLSWFST